MKRVLLTGATGFIGRHCVPHLLARGFEVHAVSSTERHDAPSDINWIKADLLAERPHVSELMSAVRPTHLLHLAWDATPGKYWTSADNLRWVQSSLELILEFARAGGRRVVVAGTCAEYDWTEGGRCVEAETPLRPATLYGTCKHALRMMMEAYAAQAGLSAAWGRVFFLYGPHEYTQRLVASVVRHLLKGERAACSHALQRRDILYVKDVASAFVSLLDSEVQGAVNIASGEAIELRAVINLIADKLDGHHLVDFGALPAAPSEPPLLVADVTRLNREVGWLPSFTLEEGLAQTIDWWRGQQTE